MARAKQGALTPNVRGYVAGLLDLKGNAYTRRQGDLVVYIMGVRDPNMQRDLLLWIGGGSFTESVSEGDRRGCTRHCKTAHIHYVRSSVRYAVSGYRAACVLHTLEPSLFTWREKFANPFAEAMARPTVAGYSVKVADDMAAKGWEIA